MKALALLVLLIATPALSEPAYYEAFDFKNCLHWNIDNEMHGADLGKEPKQYLAALHLANRQRYSRHKFMSAGEFDDVYRQHFAEVAIVYSASGFDTKNKRRVEK
ncbi:MAG: hypothetical protein M3N23_09565, partial [Pseudomonadota bacterium]|nr:hypothetical protein [Pseudomonadota bacterium]